MRSMRNVGLVVPLLLATAAPAAVDVAGKWRLPDGGIVTVGQVGDTVSLPGFIFPLHGVMTQPDYYFSFTNGGVPPGADEFAVIRLLPGGQVLQGGTEVRNNSMPTLWLRRYITMTRCGCDDGNAIDGDGCDATCRVEPCFTCTGDPSVCTPSADGAACDDRSICTAGDTCNAGVCGGAAVADCIELAGQWRFHAEAPTLPLAIDEDVVIEQRDGVVMLPTQQGVWVGTIDPVSGALVLDQPALSCLPGVTRVTGTAGPWSFATTGKTWSGEMHSCYGWNDIAVTGERLCDDGTPCDDGDACTTGDVCVDGQCQAGAPLDCGDCLACDAALGCVAAPREDCRDVPVPVRDGSLQVNDAADGRRDAIRWKWTKGPATLVDLGDPTDTNDVSFCLFDESGPSSSLLFRAALPAGPPWRPTGRGYVFRDPTFGSDGAGSISLVGGDAGRTKLIFKGKGESLSARPYGLPSPPLALPLRAQLQVEGGACFETRHDASAVRRNRPGSFRGAAVP